jgi:alkyl hydroperoxide reductase subunit AhpC
MTAKHKKATPANWPENRLFKDKVIIPPASTLEMANLNS